MNKTMRALLLASLVASPLLLAGCGNKEEAVANEATEAKKLAAPARDDDAGWKAYLPQVVQENMGTITNNPFLYYLPPESDPEFEAKYERQVEAATTAMMNTAGRLTTPPSAGPRVSASGKPTAVSSGVA